MVKTIKTMKKYIVILISMLSVAMVGCDSWLNRQPDEPKTSKNIFEKKHILTEEATTYSSGEN